MIQEVGDEDLDVEMELFKHIFHIGKNVMTEI
jgi:hypothetical protein